MMYRFNLGTRLTCKILETYEDSKSGNHTQQVTSPFQTHKTVLTTRAEAMCLFNFSLNSSVEIKSNIQLIRQKESKTSDLFSNIRSSLDPQKLGKHVPSFIKNLWRYLDEAIAMP